MVDFTNKKFFKLRPIPAEEGIRSTDGLLIDGEEIIECFSSMRDKVIFTSKRIISINTKGLTGMRKAYTSIPYKMIEVYSVTTAGLLDIDAELDISVASTGNIHFEFHGSSNVLRICGIISNIIL